MTWLLGLLAACDPPVPPIVDHDRDGVDAAHDCDDDDATTYPGAPEVGDRRDHDCDGLAPPPPRDLADPTAERGAAFGRAVAQALGTTWVGAPRAGGALDVAASRGGVWADDGRAAPRGVAGETGALLGAAIAVTASGVVLVGAPGLAADAPGEVRDSTGTVRMRALGAGRVLAARGERWATRAAVDAESAPTLDPDGARPGVAVVSEHGTQAWTLPRPPDALAILGDGTIVAGFRSGPIAIRIGTTDVLRGEDGDEAGAALAACDADADGDEDVVVGAPGSRGGTWGLPGAGAVWVLDPHAPPRSLAEHPPAARGEGRFGAALTCGDPGVVYAGAPMAGSLLEGIVRTLEDPSPVEVGIPGAHLGGALATGDDLLIIGAPGGPGVAGSVRLRLR